MADRKIAAMHRISIHAPRTGSDCAGAKEAFRKL